MTQTEIVNKLNAIYPGLDLVEVEDQYSSLMQKANATL